MTLLLTSFYLCATTIIVCNLYTKKLSRFYYIFCVFFIMFLLLFFSGNFKNPDYNNYVKMYEQAQPTFFSIKSTEFGFITLLFFAKTLGFTYQFFIFFIASICFLLISKTIFSNSPEPISVFYFWFLFPFLLDAVQIRNFIAMSIVIFAISFLLENKKNALFKYIVLILIAMSFHMLASFFLIFILYKKRNLIPYIVLIICCVFIFYYIIKHYIQSAKFSFYFFNNSTILGFLIPATIHIIILLLNNFLFKKNSFKYSSKELQYFQVCNQIGKLSCTFIPFYYINSQFIRLFRNIIILFYIAFSIHFRYLKPAKRILFFLLFLGCILFLLYVYVIKDNYISVIQAVFKNNIFFPWFN